MSVLMAKLPFSATSFATLQLESETHCPFKSRAIEIAFPTTPFNFIPPGKSLSPMNMP